MDVGIAAGMGTAAPAGERGCEAGRKVLTKEAPLRTCRNTLFAGRTIVDSPVSLRERAAKKIQITTGLFRRCLIDGMPVQGDRVFIFF